MLKLCGLVCMSILLPFSASTQHDRFPEYKPIEAYEIRPGVLMMPRYSGNGEVCEIGLQRKLYSPGKVRLDPSLSRKEVDEIFEQLVPVNERGHRSTDFGSNLISRSGHMITTNIDFEKVGIQIFSDEPSKSAQVVSGAVVATMHWKNRQCN